MGCTFGAKVWCKLHERLQWKGTRVPCTMKGYKKPGWQCTPLESPNGTNFLKPADPNIFKNTAQKFIKMVYKMWRQECSLDRFKLNHYPSEDFTISCIQKTEAVQPVWVAYRTIMFMYFLATFLFAALPGGKNLSQEDMYKFMIFLTNWTYLVESLQFGIAFIIVVMRYAKEKKRPSEMPMAKTPWHYQLYWILFTITLPCAIVVSVIFWISVYDPILFPADAHNIIVHALNSFFMLLDFALVRHPVRFLHFYLPIAYGLTYATFTLIYHAFGGTGVKGLVPIYKILDWRIPEKALMTCFFCFAFLLVLHFLFSLLSMCKMWLRQSFGNE